MPGNTYISRCASEQAGARSKEDGMDARTQEETCQVCGGWLGSESNDHDHDPEPDCEHGLSAWLCVGPSHYPMDR